MLYETIQGLCVPSFFRYTELLPELNYYVKYESSMRKARRQNVPRNPNNLIEWGDMMAEHPRFRQYYKGTVIAEDNSVALILFHDGMLAPLRKCMHLFTDGTFQVSIFDYLHL